MIVDPPAIVRPAFSVEQAVARLRELKAERGRNTLETARLFAEIRKAHPDVPGAHGPIYSPQFVQAIVNAGYSRASIATYLWLHANPSEASASKRTGSRVGKVKRAAYQRVLRLVEGGVSIDDLKEALREEINGLA